MKREPSLFSEDASRAGSPGRPAPAATPARPTALTVTQLVSALRETVESTLRHVWVKGEVSSLKAYGSGHWYFTLRDAESCVRCVMWKTYTVKVGGQPQEGAEVYALGSPTVWEERGELRFAVQVLLPTSGIGLQQLAKEQVRAALQRDGLLDPNRKRPLPEFPGTLAIVTSHDGAALRDIIIVARRRWPAIRLMVVPAKVQGEEAPGALVRALEIVNRLEGVDVCVVGRGGGAREDLLAFDDERVCRAISALRVPTISAVGHETDISLADLVADVRAATPSAAIELVLPDRTECLRHLGSLGNRLGRGLGRRTALVQARLARTGDRMQVAMARRTAEPRVQLDRLASQLEALSPLRVLSRGYSVARLRDGRVARRRDELPPGTKFTLRVSDGELPAVSEPET